VCTTHYGIPYIYRMWANTIIKVSKGRKQATATEDFDFHISYS